MVTAQLTEAQAGLTALVPQTEQLDSQLVVGALVRLARMAQAD